MRLKKDSSKQKLRGAYYTPQKLANAMVRLFASENIDAVLEPSCGDGVFLDALKEAGLLDKFSRVEAVEIETPEAQKVSGRYKDTLKVDVYKRQTKGRKHDSDGFKIRRSAVEHSVTCVTAIDTARAVLTVREQSRSVDLKPIDITKI